MQNQYFHAIATMRGVVIQTDEKLSLLNEDGLLIDLTYHWRCRPCMQPPVGCCVAVTGYPRFGARTGALESLTISTFHCMHSLRSPGQFSISGIVFASVPGQIILKTVPRFADPFFVPIAGNLPEAQEREIWRIQAELSVTGSLKLLYGEKSRDIIPRPRSRQLPKLKKKKKTPVAVMLRQQRYIAI